jgi:hypothetical protein
LTVPWILIFAWKVRFGSHKDEVVSKVGPERGLLTFNKIFNIFSDFILPDMPCPLRYGASLMDFTQKIKEKLKGTK